MCSCRVPYCAVPTVLSRFKCRSTVRSCPVIDNHLNQLLGVEDSMLGLQLSSSYWPAESTITGTKSSCAGSKRLTPLLLVMETTRTTERSNIGHYPFGPMEECPRTAPDGTTRRDRHALESKTISCSRYMSTWCHTRNRSFLLCTGICQGTGQKVPALTLQSLVEPHWWCSI